MSALIGIYASAHGDALGAGSNASVMIDNAGSVTGGSLAGTAAGIFAYSRAGTTIVNLGDITAASLLAIHTAGPGNVQIFNSGTITGFVVLDADDTMVIEPGGTFEARLTSDFGPGEDLFRNEGIVHALKHDGEQPTFIDLERFENKGTI